MNQQKEKRLLELTGQLCDETLSEEGFIELDELLKTDAEARAVYRSFSGLNCQLEDGFLNREESSVSPPLPFYQRPLTGWLAASVAALVAILAFSSKLSQPEAPTVPNAVLTRAVDLKWEHPKRFRAEVGQAITEQWLRLESGIAEIEFASGATLSMKGPAHLRIDDEMNCFSRFGKLAANCPDSAHGFTIRFPGGKVIDLGTEFMMNSAPGGETNVHVLTGEVVVAKTDGERNVVDRQSLLEHSAVTVDPLKNRIESIDFDAEPFEPMQRDNLIRSAPIKLQFDIGHRAGLYRGTDSPGHTSGDFYPHEDVWTQIVGDQSGAVIMADGNPCPFPLRVDYGHGDGEIDWSATPMDPRGQPYYYAAEIFNNALCQDHRVWDEDLALRISGLPAGTYRIYALCRSIRRPEASYDVSFGVNLYRQPSKPDIMPRVRIPKPIPKEPIWQPDWEEGKTYMVGEVTLTGPNDWATFITRYVRERSKENGIYPGRSVLLGLQIVELR